MDNLHILILINVLLELVTLVQYGFVISITKKSTIMNGLQKSIQNVFSTQLLYHLYNTVILIFFIYFLTVPIEHIKIITYYMYIVLALGVLIRIAKIINNVVLFDRIKVESELKYDCDH